jgi:hypothetical protein
MKIATQVVFALALAASISGLAAPENKAASPAKSPEPVLTKAKPVQPAGKQELATFTGSYIPQQAPVRGQIVGTTSPLVVIDNDAIKRSGAHDVADLLRRGGWAR